MSNNIKTAFVFPGQGAQFSGMGKTLYENSPAAKKVFEAAESIRQGTIKQCLEAPKEELTLTVNAQPCIFTVSLASAASYKEKGLAADAVAGFSIGELSSLTFAEVLSFEDGFKAVLKRAELMTEGASKTKGSMAAILKLPEETVLRLCAECGVYAVNFNCPGQIVVSGEENAVAELGKRAAAEGGRAMPLAVSGAFHSPYMAEASAKFAEYLQNLKFSVAKMPVYSNLTAKPYTDAGAKETLARQIQNPVLWQQTVCNMLDEGFTDYIEAEPGNVLTGLITKIREKHLAEKK